MREFASDSDPPPDSVGGSWPSGDPARPVWDARTEQVSEYDYNRADGAYSFTVRKGRNPDGEKVFTIARRNMLPFGDRLEPEDRKDWLSGKGDEPHTLYHLPEVLAAAKDALIFICEGEKDADNMRAVGLIATTGSCGANKWREEFSQHLADRDVVILPDNDDVGREHAARVLRSVHSVARSVKVVELPGLPPKGDVSDWLNDGGTKEDLLALISETVAVADPAAWAAAHGQFATDKDGKLYRSPENARTALTKMGVEVSYDTFACRYLLTGLEGFGPVLDDAALTRTRLLAEERWSLSYGKDRWADIITDHARRQSFHPVRDYLAALQWDGVERLDRWLITYAEAEDSEYVRTVGAIVLIAAVRRVRQPGCKFDEMLVIESPQGLGKSSALSILAVQEDWFADDLPLDSDSKVVMERIAGRWIVELAELKGMRRGAVEHVKSMVSRRVDKARLAYGRMTTEQPRQCVFFGTTNDNAYLRDMTGNRRFWPVRLKQFDLAALRQNRDQLWAEAAHREAAGESIRLPEQLWAVAGEQQSEREVGDPFYELLSVKLAGLSGKVSSNDIWGAVGLCDPKLRTQDHNMRLSSVMQKLGWSRPTGKLRIDGKPQHAWVKGEPELGGSYPLVDLGAGEM